MLKKLLLWRQSVIQKPPLNPILSSHLPSSLLIFIARFRSHSPPEDDHDPPFSPSHSGTQKERNDSKINKKKHKFPKIPNKSDEHPVKSELPFDFMYSYSETSTDVEPIGFREPRLFSPFGPGRIDRMWTGTRAPVQRKCDSESLAEERERVMGEPLSEKEIAELVDKYRHNDCASQINLGKGGVTHNTLVDIHNHWKRAEAVRIKCLGVPTLDMDNICFHLEDKTGGKIIYRRINILLLYRGRNYDPSKKPDIPMMLWKPHSPIYPRLVKSVADGLTFEETKEKRNIGLKSPPLMKLSRNGVYVNVVERVRTAFETEEIVRLDCAHVGKSDCKKIGVKLRDLVPCVPLLFKDDQIIIWRGNKEPG